MFSAFAPQAHVRSWHNEDRFTGWQNQKVTLPQPDSDPREKVPLAWPIGRSRDIAKFALDQEPRVVSEVSCAATSKESWTGFNEPVIVSTSNIKETFAIEDVSDFLVLVEMLIEEHFHFSLVRSAHLLWRNRNLVPILVRSL
jgi:hypothetical protein